MDKLKPCPFCGGKVNTTINFGLLFFKCKRCGAVISFDNKECNQKPIKSCEYFNTRTPKERGNT